MLNTKSPFERVAINNLSGRGVEVYENDEYFVIYIVSSISCWSFNKKEFLKKVILCETIG